MSKYWTMDSRPTNWMCRHPCLELIMKSKCYASMKGDMLLNPLTHLWRWIDASRLLLHHVSEFMKIGEPTIVAMLGNVEDEWTFSTLSFMKNRLRNWLSRQLPKVVNMHAQQLYGLNDNPVWCWLWSMTRSSLCTKKIDLNHNGSSYVYRCCG